MIKTPKKEVGSKATAECTFFTPLVNFKNECPPPIPVKSMEREREFQIMIEKFASRSDRDKRYERYVDRQNLIFIEQQENENKAKGYSK